MINGIDISNDINMIFDHNILYYYIIYYKSNKKIITMQCAF